VQRAKVFLSQLKAREPAALKKLAFGAVAASVAAAIMFGSLDSGSSGSVAPKTQQTPEASLFVDIVGAVVRPGVYPVNTATRLFEVVSAAGGFTKQADQSSVNLARLVTDGEQITVLARGAGAPADPKSSTIDLNSASEQDLESLPGVGPTLAARIVDYRTANGKFTKVDDLLKVGGIGDKLFGRLRNMVRT
jgi:competence protein ComEA